MAEHALHRSQISAVHEQVGRERMSERVRTDFFGDAREFRIVLDDALHRAGSQAEAFTFGVTRLKPAIPDEEGNRGIATGVQVGREPFTRLWADEHRAIFLTFTSHHEFATLEVDVIAVEIDEL